MKKLFPFNNSRNHQDLPIKELETIPRSTFDLDVFKVEIYYHKTQTIILSFIGGKITYYNIAIELSILKFVTSKDNMGGYNSKWMSRGVLSFLTHKFMKLLRAHSQIKTLMCTIRQSLFNVQIVPKSSCYNSRLIEKCLSND